MSLVLLRPALLAYKNRLVRGPRRFGISREALFTILGVILIWGVFRANLTFFQTALHYPGTHVPLLGNLLRLMLLGFFLILILSSTIVALSALYMSQELSVLLVAPVSEFELFRAKVIEIGLTASWVFLVFFAPMLYAYGAALHLGFQFYVIATFVLCVLILIPAMIGVLIVTLLVNLMPPNRMRDCLVLLSFLMSCAILALGNETNFPVPTREAQMQQLVAKLALYSDPQPWWFPSRWAGEVFLLCGNGQYASALPFLGALFFSVTLVGSFGFFLFDLLFRRGFAVASRERRQPRIYGSRFFSAVGDVVFRRAPEFRAILTKEGKMFFRDTTQALQLLLLLLLTFMYLYNFRSLRTVAQISQGAGIWWELILTVANVMFGTCILAALAARFVFPSMSLEGRAYSVLRTTPLPVDALLRYKFYTWLIPVVFLSLILFVSGTLAIQSPWQAVVATVVVAVSVSIGIVGLGIGMGAVYAKFDWDNSGQVVASFGSLIYMLFSFFVIALCFLPTLFLFVLTTVPEFVERMHSTDYWFLLLGSLFLILLTNLAAARRALAAGTDALLALERER